MRVLQIALCLALVACARPVAPSPPSMGEPFGCEGTQPSDQEQYMLQLVNRARADPGETGRALGASRADHAVAARRGHPEFFEHLEEEFRAFAPAQPLAFEPHLIAAARAHARDMVEHGYFRHEGRDGSSPTARARRACYPSGLGGVAENIGLPGVFSPRTAERAMFEFLVDHANAAHDTHPLGHRLAILNPEFNRVGIGIQIF